MTPALEALRFLSLDEVITQVKLNGSAAEVMGVTTPEGWPFIIVVAVAKPGNEKALLFAKEFSEKMILAASWTQAEGRCHNCQDLKTVIDHARSSIETMIRKPCPACQGDA